MTTDRACTECRQIITDDPSGQCEACQDVRSQRPGSITTDQRSELTGVLMARGLAGRDQAWVARAAFFKAVLGDDWLGGSSVTSLSEDQAGRVLVALAELGRRHDA